MADLTRTIPPFRADVVGSYLRPEKLSAPAPPSSRAPLTRTASGRSRTRADTAVVHDHITGEGHPFVEHFKFAKARVVLGLVSTKTSKLEDEGLLAERGEDRLGSVGKAGGRRREGVPPPFFVVLLAGPGG